MTQVANLQNVFEEELREIFNAEDQLVSALGKMASSASSFTLQKAFRDHLEETEDQLARLEQIGADLHIELRGKECKAMKGLIEEVSEILDQQVEDASLKDVMLIAAAQKIEHYEISSYGTLCALAQNLELTSAIDLLQESLDEESVIDERLTEITEDEVFSNITSIEEDSDEIDSTTSSPKYKGRGAGGFSRSR